jgi:hypothetical protein
MYIGVLSTDDGYIALVKIKAASLEDAIKKIEVYKLELEKDILVNFLNFEVHSLETLEEIQ